ncbi:MAG: glycosyltransferase family 2 protein [Bacteroidales bacterium]
MSIKQISFLITCYNLKEWLLKRCIDSIRNQFADQDIYEIILVDDGSDFFPEHLLSGYKDADIVYLRQENMGPGGARNTCMEKARGRYLFFIDGDDYLLEGSIEKISGLLQREQPDILCIKHRKCTDKNYISNQIPELKSKAYPTGCQYMLQNNMTGANGFYIFSKELAKRYQLRFPLKTYHEDEEFFTKLFFHAGKVLKTNIPAYAYYFRSDSIVNNESEDRNEKRISDFIGVIERLQLFKKEQSKKRQEQELKALKKKTDYLALDATIKILRTSDHEFFLNKFSPVMKKAGILPLPDRNDSFKYIVYRSLFNYKQGRRLLRLADDLRSKRI